MHASEYRQHLAEEIIQRRDEGADVTALKAEHDRLAQTQPDATSVWADFYSRVYSEEYDALKAANEPSDLPGIQACRSSGPRRLDVDASRLESRMHGAWLGRIAGCILGKPVEGKPKTYIDTYLRLAGMADLDGYFPYMHPIPAELDASWMSLDFIEGSLAGKIQCAERDDDIDYTILGLHYVEKYGPGFSAKQVADEWLDLLPINKVYTAERVAYKNLVNGMTPPESGIRENPYREWIGAQIRADAFGYVNAGYPENAAAMAYNDAIVSHIRNGIYGEMWSAAMIAAAFAVDDPRTAIEIGLSEIPEKSRLADAGRKLLDWSREYPTWDGCWERARLDYGHLNWVHTINNALWVMIGLLYGECDFGRTISIAVRCGDDTDCNGATAGSVIGALCGRESIPGSWTDVFHDRVRSYVIGFDSSRITDLARRTLVQYQRVCDARTN